MLEEVRAHLRERGRTQTQWEVGSSAPPGLVDALLARGVRPDKDPYAVALVLTREPPPMRPGFTARRVETLEELEAACEVQWEAFGASPEEIAEARSLLPTLFAREHHGPARGLARRRARLHGHGVADRARAAALRRRDGGTRPRPRRLPSTDPRPLGRGGRARHAGPDHPGRLDVAPDPGAPRLRARRRGAHAAGRLRLDAVERVRVDRGKAPTRIELVCEALQASA